MPNTFSIHAMVELHSNGLLQRVLKRSGVHPTTTNTVEQLCDSEQYEAAHAVIQADCERTAADMRYLQFVSSYNNCQCGICFPESLHKMGIGPTLINTIVDMCSNNKFREAFLLLEEQK
ncbi:hypothetical protein D3C78_18590 [compost metagenome]